MIKYLFLLINMLGVMLFNAFFADDISVSQTGPAKVNPGEDFTVEITVKKGAMGGFAQIKSELPEGMTAMVQEANGAEFKFSGQIVRFTWTSLPSTPEFKVSYKVSVASTVSGVKSITGKFSYVLNNQKSSVELNPLEIQVGNVVTENIETTPTTTTTTTTPPDNTTTTTTNTPPPPDNTTTTTNTPPPPDNTTTNNTPPDNTNNTPPPDNTTNRTTGEPVKVTASRKVPKEVKPGDEFNVEVTIFKGAIKGFGRFQDVLPDGFTATGGESSGGTFTFMDQKAKILWENMPGDETFTVSYKVKVENSAVGDQQIEGLFSYAENDEPKKIAIAPSFISVIKKVEVVTNNPPPDNTNNNPPPDNTNKVPDNTVTNTPPPSTGVSYKVQICASHSTVGSSYFQGRYGLTENVSLENQDGWVKYVVGSHKTYKEAHDSRDGIRGKGIYDAFVTAYNQGKRITVQEALMISQQTWVK